MGEDGRETINSDIEVDREVIELLNHDSDYVLVEAHFYSCNTLITKYIIYLSNRFGE